MPIINGTPGDDFLNGTNVSDTIYGFAGNDNINLNSTGGAADTMIGGPGDDHYAINSSNDVIIELAGEGYDTAIVWGGTYVLQPNTHLEYIGIIGTALIGNELPNNLNGGVGGVILMGEGGDDILNGIAGSVSGNDILNGGTGVDQMTGHKGNDVYIVDSVDDQIYESAGQGNDIVYTSGNYTLRAGVSAEVLLTDAPAATTAINLSGNEFGNAITGNAGANILLGNGGDDALIGLGGNDNLDGGAGLDITNGGAGDDIHIVDSVDDVVLEAAGESRDLVFTSSNYVLRPGVSVELLLTTAQAAATVINLSGNELDNIIQGNAGSNILFGDAGADIILAFQGDDFINGGSGADILNGGPGDDIYFTDTIDDIVLEDAGNGRDMVYTTSNYTLRAGVSVELLLADPQSGTVAINLTGNEFDNNIQGNAGTNILFGGGGADLILGYAGGDTLDGGTGVDTLIGGTGDDVYFVDNAADLIIENAGEGRDFVYASTTFELANGIDVEMLIADPNAGPNLVYLIGNNIANTIQGNEFGNRLVGSGGDDTLIGLGGRDFLDGGFGSDTLIGGDGNDVYILNDLDDTIIEEVNGGSDTVTVNFDYTLAEGSTVENVALTYETMQTSLNLTGNSGANQIQGNAGSNRMLGGSGDDFIWSFAGNDILDGGSGADYMQGGEGDDIYYIDNASEWLWETFDEGNDTAITSVSYNDHGHQFLYIETFKTSNQVGTEPLNLIATGVLLLEGNNGDNLLSTGSSDGSTIRGFNGNDTIYAGYANDALDGGDGNDILEGGPGSDIFLFTSALATTGIDSISDFASGADRVMLSSGPFAALPVGTLSASSFVVGTVAADADDRILYNSASGALYYDPDGNGSQVATYFASLTGAPTLVASDIVVV